MAKRITIGAILAGLAAVCGLVWFSPGLTAFNQTTGSIYVSGPQVYTRERLVNDRYREDAWLAKELLASSDKDFGITMSTSRSIINSFGISGNVQPSGTPAAPEVKKPDAPAVTVGVEISPHDRLNALSSYREQIRTQMIENQLDDRHDLRGNSLYRLRFDAAVLPGANTQTGARITISILPPENLLKFDHVESLDNKALRKAEDRLSNLSRVQELDSDQRVVWDRIYSRWLSSLGKRFEDSRQAIHRSFDSNRFTAIEYDGLLVAIRAQARLSWAQLAGVENLPTGKTALRTLPAEMVHRISARLNESDLAPQAANRVAIDALRKATVRNDVVRTDDPGHQEFKGEIERLINIVQQGYRLMSALTFAAQRMLSAPSGIAPAATVSAVEGCGDLGEYGLNPIGLQTTPFIPSLEFFLDSEFEPKLSMTVLGLGPNRLSDFTMLDNFASGIANFGAAGPAFRFSRQRPSFVITDNIECFAAPLRKDVETIQSPSRTVYVYKQNLAAIRKVLPNYDPRPDIDEVVTAKWGPAPQGAFIPVPAHVETIFVEVGLVNFIRMAGRQLDVFSYAFTPSEPDELNAIEARTEQSRMLAAQATGKVLNTDAAGSINLQLAEIEARRRNALRKLVVSFGDQPNSVTARFGWVIQPQDPLEGNRYRHRASQTSLTAIVSLPAWWEEIRVKVEPSWDGEAAPAQKSQDYVIVLPVNFETVDANLFESNDRSPVIGDWAANGLTVTACERTEILIPGRRLWRSTVVTLGGQRASQIYVMPDMNGIVATFEPVDFPSAWTDLGKSFQVPLTVWTSQGSAAERWVTFKAPRLAQRGCVEKTK